MNSSSLPAITPLTEADWPAVAATYAEGIAGGNATFETSVPDWASWNAAHAPECRLTARVAGEIVGWAALTPVSGRCVYAGVGEVSVYVAARAHGQGIGTALLSALIDSSEQAGYWTLQAGILRENSASIALHERCGFRRVGYRERLGQLAGVWRDVLLFERRSAINGR